ncbi:sigma-70 family RNA polymerase sigma factor [Gryllotalpicola protaetiae]|uniref:RNA polymerase sigma factor n=1 Tax=Gryllotalpicola protaetiae TaxID=2419771 RepID=A0A387BRK5_9MICO|nr:sigma-70 family RNA polymerase sigma factor [Gryllotalpicola protaetiae]AYG03700.1 sigma-70 family RNA polymerase sigma factor [Gryllotalpicola protaetiae]
MPNDDDALLRALHDQHARPLWRYVMSLTGDAAQSEDIVQETLLRAWKRPAVLDQREASARAWLFTVARNLVIDESRSARRRHETVTAAETMPEPVAADETERMLDAWLIGDALAALTAEHRQVIVEAYYGGKSVAEVAAVVGVPEGTVKSRLHYGLRALRLALQEKGVTR